MKNINSLKFLFVVLVYLVSFSVAGEKIEKEIVKDEITLKLKALDPEVKGGTIRYEIPNLRRKSLSSVVSSGLLTNILSHGAKVCFEFKSEEVDKNDLTKMLEFGTYIVSVEPSIFKTGDTIVISVFNVSYGN